MKKKRILASLVMVLVMSVMSTFPVQAADNLLDVANVIKKVDFSENFKEVNVGNGISMKFVRDYSAMTRSGAYDSYSGYYYLTGTGEKVAVFKFSARFSYDGDKVSYKSSSASCEPVKDDWAISYSLSHDDSQKVLSTASSVFKLYKDGNYNNSNTVTISCTKDGSTSTISN